MSKFGELAVTVARHCAASPSFVPRNVWRDLAKQTFGSTSSCVAKSCPKSAFLGLCEEGLVHGIPQGSYTRSTNNKAYAVRAAKEVFRLGAVPADQSEWWRTATDDKGIVMNNQLEVVEALWREGLLVEPP